MPKPPPPPSPSPATPAQSAARNGELAAFYNKMLTAPPPEPPSPPYPGAPPFSPWPALPPLPPPPADQSHNPASLTFVLFAFLFAFLAVAYVFRVALARLWRRKRTGAGLGWSALPSLELPAGMPQLNGSSLPPRLAPLADRLERERRFLRRIPAAISSIFESIRRAREESAADQEEEAEEFERRQRAQEDAAGDLVMGATGAGDVDAAPEPEVYVSAAEEEDEMEAAGIRAPQPPERMVTAPLIDPPPSDGAAEPVLVDIAEPEPEPEGDGDDANDLAADDASVIDITAQAAAEEAAAQAAAEEAEAARAAAEAAEAEAAAEAARAAAEAAAAEAAAAAAAAEEAEAARLAAEAAAASREVFVLSAHAAQAFGDAGSSDEEGDPPSPSDTVGVLVISLDGLDTVHHFRAAVKQALEEAPPHVRAAAAGMPLWHQAAASRLPLQVTASTKVDALAASARIWFAPARSKSKKAGKRRPARASERRTLLPIPGGGGHHYVGETERAAPVESSLESGTASSWMGATLD